MKNNINKFDWGESAKVKIEAPIHFRPGQIVSVCGMTKIKSKKLADKYKSNLGEWIYTIDILEDLMLKFLNVI